ALIEMGNSPPGTSYNTTGEGVPLINGPSEFSPDPLGYALLSQYTTEPTKLCRPGDLLICVRGATTGRTNIAAFEACLGRGVGLIRAGDLQPYVNRYVVSRRADILAKGSGSTFPSISYRHLAELLLPLPPSPNNTASSPRSTASWRSATNSRSGCRNPAPSPSRSPRRSFTS